MKLPPRKIPGFRRSRSHDLPGISATARMDHRTKNLTKRLRHGDIAIIDHYDLDRVSAEALLGREVAAVVNAAVSISGRYPNLGPELLIEAGIPLIDDVGPEVFERISDGQQIRLDGETLYLGGEVVAKGTVQDAESVAVAMADAKAGMADQLKAFAANTIEYISRDSELLIQGIQVPDLRVEMEGRHVLVVARGYRHRDDLQALRAYIREFKPIMVAVDGGANALLEAGYRPDLIVGDMDSVSDRALRCGAELVVHAYPNGVAPGLARVQDLGLPSVQCPATGTSEDLAVLLADEMGATLIVAVGMRFSMTEFLDKGRPGMASAVLTRMKVGDKIVDAKGVSRLYRSRISGRALSTLVLAAMVAVLAAASVSGATRVLLSFFLAQWDTFTYWFTGLL
ncbi:MAG: putative cytokinetic ring protein SteA [Actinomycetota bacterium]